MVGLFVSTVIFRLVDRTRIVLLAGGVVFGRAVRVGSSDYIALVRCGVSVVVLPLFGTRRRGHGLLGFASPTVVRSNRIPF